MINELKVKRNMFEAGLTALKLYTKEVEEYVESLRGEQGPDPEVLEREKEVDYLYAMVAAFEASLKIESNQLVLSSKRVDENLH